MQCIVGLLRDLYTRGLTSTKLCALIAKLGECNVLLAHYIRSVYRNYLAAPLAAF